MILLLMRIYKQVQEIILPLQPSRMTTHLMVVPKQMPPMVGGVIIKMVQVHLEILFQEKDML